MNLINKQTMTSLVNVRVKYIRPEYKNLKEWCEDENNIYIGRKGVVFIDGKRYPENNSKWCNPYKIDKNNSRENVIKKYREYILNNNKLLNDLHELKNKTLGCWCKPDECHGDVLIKLLNDHRN